MEAAALRQMAGQRIGIINIEKALKESEVTVFALLVFKIGLHKAAGVNRY